MGKERGYKKRVGGREEGWMEGGREGGGGREGAIGWWGREGEREGESKGREVGSDDARQAESVSRGREG